MNEVPKGCKPFNLQEALAGKKVITRDGRPVKIAGFDSDAEPSFEIVGWASGVAASWSIYGQYHNNGKSDADLFMVCRTKDVWVVLYEYRISMSSKVFNTLEDAKAFSNTISPTYIQLGIHKITIEI